MSYKPKSKKTTPELAASVAEEAMKVLEGRWKMVIIFHLFSKGVLRFSELDRSIVGVTQKMLIQQLRELERDGVVLRKVYPEVPPKVEYCLTALGKDLCPALDELLIWANKRKTSLEAVAGKTADAGSTPKTASPPPIQKPRQRR